MHKVFRFVLGRSSSSSLCETSWATYYKKPMSYFFPIPNGDEKQTEEDRSHNLFQVIRENTRLLIIGECGAGKTFSLEKILMDCASKNENSLKAFPVFIELQGCFVEGINARINRFLEEFSMGEIAFETIRDSYPNKYLIFLFDGIDEINRLDFSMLGKMMDEFLTEFPGCRFIITSRPLFWLKNERLLGLEAFEIMRLSSGQIKCIINAYFNGNHIKIKTLLRSLNNKKFFELVTNPLLLTLVCQLVEGKLTFP